MPGNLKVGCHVSIAGGVFNAPKNAADLGCETFQIFSRSPRGGPAAVLTPEIIKQFKAQMDQFEQETFVIHCPYYINFGSSNPKIYFGSSSVVRDELERGSLLGASFVMTHLGSCKDLGQKEAFKKTREGLVKVLTGYKGQTKFLLEIAAGSGEVIGGSFDELAELMEPLKKFETFGGICFDTQHAFASGYDLRGKHAIEDTFETFDKVIGLKWLKMSHINDSKVDFGSKKDRHEHIGEGQIGEKGFVELLKFWSGAGKSPKNSLFPLILETEHDKVETDIKILKKLRDKTL